jgi:hypothetical protein
MSKPYLLSPVVFSIIPCLPVFISLPWSEVTLRIEMSLLCLSLLTLFSTLCPSILVEVLLVVVSLPQELIMYILVKLSESLSLPLLKVFLSPLVFSILCLLLLLLSLTSLFVLLLEHVFKIFLSQCETLLFSFKSRISLC